MRRRAVRLSVALVVALAIVPAGTSVARVQTSPFNYDFGGQAAGTSSSPVTFTLRVSCNEDVANPGTCLLVGGADPLTPNVTVSGPFAIRNNTCTSPMPGNTFFGTSCTFGVVFFPLSIGAYTGIVDVGDPAGRGRAGVSGTGLTFPLAGPGPAPPPGETKKKCKRRRAADGAAAAAKKKCRRKK